MADASLVLHRTVCNHFICANCVVTELGAESGVACRICGTIVVPSDLVSLPSRREAAHAARELEVRKRVVSVFNRQREDFSDPREWFAYLGTIEDVVSDHMGSQADIERGRRRLSQQEQDTSGDIAQRRARQIEAARRREERWAALDATASETTRILTESEKKRNRQVSGVISAALSEVKAGVDFEQVQTRAARRQEQCEAEQVQPPIKKEPPLPGATTVTFSVNVAQEDAETAAMADTAKMQSLHARAFMLDDRKVSATTQARKAQGGVTVANAFDAALFT